MKARIRFNKYGTVKFIGHLDLMRYFQKAFRRAEIDIAYSQGFNPHQLTSFASPLGVGITSDGEYMDMQLNSAYPEEEMISRLNAQMAEGIEVLSFRVLDDACKKSMAAVAAADYRISIRDGYEFCDGFAEKFKAFMEQDEIIIEKKTKKSTAEVNLKPLVFQYALTAEEFAPHTSTDLTNTVATDFENGNVVYMKVSSGSVDNLKPELVIEAFCQYAGIEYNPFALQIHRIDMYANDVTKKEAEEGKVNLVSLDAYEVVK